MENATLNVYAPEERTPELLHRLTAVWEDSVQATHRFLSNEEIQKIKACVPQALSGISTLVAVEREPGRPVAFMSMDGARLEMLSVASAERGRGLGRRLIEAGIRTYGLREVTVNEQNPQAIGFYEHLGFRAYKQTDHDEQGNPYPLLYMRLT